MLRTPLFTAPELGAVWMTCPFCTHGLTIIACTVQNTRETSLEPNDITATTHRDPDTQPIEGERNLAVIACDVVCYDCSRHAIVHSRLPVLV
jgi:hypothetical protein